MAKFLVVDDEPVLQYLYREILQLKGHEILGEAYNGNDCINKIKNDQLHPDFILMDHRMPRKNGLDAMKELLVHDPKLRVIFLSADDSVEEEVLSAGAVLFLKKPFTLDTFENILEQLMDD